MGVFLSPHAKPIKKGKIVTLYTGEYHALPDEQLFHEYSYCLPPHPLFSDQILDSPHNVVLGSIDATHCGNIARYLQDLPTESELEEYYVLPNDKTPSIATANLSGVLAAYCRYPIVYFVATRDIQPGEQLGFSYKAGYWVKAKCLRNMKRCLFDKSGQIFEDILYINSITLHFNINAINHYYSFALSKLKLSIIYNLGTSSFTFVTMNHVEITCQSLLTACQQALHDLDGMQNTWLKELSDIVDAKAKLQNPRSSYQVIFCNNIRLILIEHLIKHETTPDVISKQKVSYIKKLQTSVYSLPDNAGDQTFNIVCVALKDPNCAAFYEEHLPEMRSELIGHMNKYNQDKTKSLHTSDMVMSSSKQNP